MLEQQQKTSCGGNSFIFSSILFCLFIAVVWLFILIFNVNTDIALHQSSTTTTPKPYLVTKNIQPNHSQQPQAPSASYPVEIIPDDQNENLINIKSQAAENQLIQLEAKISDQKQQIKRLAQQKKKIKGECDEVVLLQQQRLSTSISKNNQLNQQTSAVLASTKQHLSTVQATLSSKQDEIKNREQELSSLRKQLENTDIQISELRNRFTVFDIKQEILFNEAEARLNKTGRKAIAALAKIFRQYPDRLIAIQGHTDNQSVGKSLQKKYKSNWILAAARSASAIDYLQNVEKINPDRMVLVSYSQYRPIRSNKTAKGRANNRRIEVILMPKDFNFMRESTE